MDDWLASIILSWSYSLISLEEYNASLQTNYFKAVMILSNWKSLAGNWSFLVRPNITKHVRTILFYRSVYVLLEKDKTYTVKKEAKQLRRFVVVLPQVLWQTTHRWGYGRTDRQAEGQTDRWANGHTEDCTDKQDHRQRLASNHADIQCGIGK